MPEVCGIVPFGTDYAEALKYATEWAGDNQAHTAVVEDFGDEGADNGTFLVMSYVNALAYIDNHDAEIQDDPDYRPGRFDSADYTDFGGCGPRE